MIPSPTSTPDRLATHLLKPLRPAYMNVDAAESAIHTYSLIWYSVKSGKYSARSALLAWTIPGQDYITNPLSTSVSSLSSQSDTSLLMDKSSSELSSYIGHRLANEGILPCKESSSCSVFSDWRLLNDGLGWTGYEEIVQAYDPLSHTQYTFASTLGCIGFVLRCDRCWIIIFFIGLQDWFPIVRSLWRILIVFPAVLFLVSLMTTQLTFSFKSFAAPVFSLLRIHFKLLLEIIGQLIFGDRLSSLQVRLIWDCGWVVLMTNICQYVRY